MSALQNWKGRITIGNGKVVIDVLDAQGPSCAVHAEELRKRLKLPAPVAVEHKPEFSQSEDAVAVVNVTAD